MGRKARKRPPAERRGREYETLFIKGLYRPVEKFGLADALFSRIIFNALRKIRLYRRLKLPVCFGVVTIFYSAAGMGLSFCRDLYSLSLPLKGRAGFPAPLPLILRFGLVLLVPAFDIEKKVGYFRICPATRSKAQNQASIFLHIHILTSFFNIIS